MKTRVVHCKKEPYDVYIGRPSEWGNPFVVKGKQPEARERAIALYREMVESDPAKVARIRSELSGKVLGCWCSPLRCHGDVLAEIADSGTSNDVST